MRDPYAGVFDDEIPWRSVPVRPPLPAAPDLSTPDEVGLLYADVVAQDAHVQSLTADVAIYRELLQQALDSLAALTATVAKQQARIAQLVDRCR